jgi:hypothetical protein
VPTQNRHTSQLLCREVPTAGNRPRASAGNACLSSSPSAPALPPAAADGGLWLGTSISPCKGRRAEGSDILYLNPKAASKNMQLMYTVLAVSRMIKAIMAQHTMLIIQFPTLLGRSTAPKMLAASEYCVTVRAAGATSRGGRPLVSVVGVGGLCGFGPATDDARPPASLAV